MSDYNRSIRDTSVLVISNATRGPADVLTLLVCCGALPALIAFLSPSDDFFEVSGLSIDGVSCVPIVMLLQGVSHIRIQSIATALLLQQSQTSLTLAIAVAILRSPARCTRSEA